MGRTLFMNKCGTCHSLFKTIVGPKLGGVLDKEEWKDRKKLYAWIRNPGEFMKTEGYLQGLKKEFGTMMQGFPTITDDEIGMILLYIKEGSEQ